MKSSIVKPMRQRRAEPPWRRPNRAGRFLMVDQVGRFRRERHRLDRLKIQAQELERARLARDLHDELGHRIMVTIIGIDAVSHQYGDQPGIRESLGAIRGQLVEAITAVHDVAFNLCPQAVTDLGLAPALRMMAHRADERTGPAVRFSSRGRVDGLDHDVTVAAFRIAQEALTNSLRYAGALNLMIELVRVDERLILEVADDGQGFSAAARRNGNCPRLGIPGMHERARLAGGHVEIETGPGLGTLIRAVLPAREASA